MTVVILLVMGLSVYMQHTYSGLTMLTIVFQVHKVDWRYEMQASRFK